MRTNQSSLDTYHSGSTFVFTNTMQAAMEKFPYIADDVLFEISIIRTIFTTHTNILDGEFCKNSQKCSIIDV